MTSGTSSSPLARSGFTLVELLVVIAIIGVLSALVAPSLRDAMLSARMTAMTNDLLADINIARSEAVKQTVPMTLCPSSNGASCSGTNWATGWIIFSDTTSAANSAPNGVVNGTDAIIKVTPALTNTNPNALIVRAGGSSPSSITYGASGAVIAGAAPPITFTFCDLRAGTAAQLPARMRVVTINTTGRPLQIPTTCVSP